MHFLFIRVKNSSYDLPWALLELEHTVEDFQHKDFDPLVPDPEGFQKLEDTVEARHYDMIISYLFLPEVSEICNRHSLKYIAWSYDSPLITLYHPAVLNPCNYLFLFDRSEYEYLKDYHIPHLYYLPMGVNISRTGALNIVAEDEERFQCDISFIGSLYEKNSYNTFISSLPEHLANELKLYLLQNLCSWHKPKPWPRTSALLTSFFEDNFAAGQWGHYNMDLDLYLGVLILSRKLAEMDRVTVLNTLAEQFPVDLYTLSDCSHLSNVNVHKNVDYYSEMNKVFYLSKINLNITLPSIVTGMPQRILDIMGSGGFVMTNYQAEIDDYFTIGKDIEVFHDLDELKEKTHYYLTHEKERQKIAINGYLNVRDHFSYTHQVQKILDIVKEDSD